MELRLICGTKYFKFDESVKNIKFDVFNLSNDNNTLFGLIGSPDFIRNVGIIEINVLNTNPHFTSAANIDYYINPKVETPLRLSEKKAELLQTFMNCLWFIKDCCSNIGKLYVYNPTDKSVFYRMRTVFFSSSKGDYATTTFSNCEVQQAMMILNKVISLLAIDNALENDLVKKNPERIGEITPGDFNFHRYNSTTRLQRAFMFLSMARSNSFLPLKISSYIEIFETLFTTDNSEVSHKVSERLAFYIGGNTDEKVENFKLMKTAYGVRSKFVHGQKLDRSIKNIDDLVSVSTKIDSLARALLTKIVLTDSTIFLKDDNALNQHFSNMIFERNNYSSSS